MLHLMKYNLMVKIKCVNVVFWPLVFPLILGTLFYFAFGSMEEADFETVQTIVVKEADADPVFLEFLETMETDESHLVEVREMSGEEARLALEEKKASGIYLWGRRLRLRWPAAGSRRASWSPSWRTMKMENRPFCCRRKHPEGMQNAMEQMGAYEELVEQVSLGGTTTNGNAQFFYALIAMACLYGAFIGMDAAFSIQANLTALAARRCVTPTHKLKLVLTEMLSCFLLHYLNVLILLAYLRFVLRQEFYGQMPQMLLISLIGSMMGVSMGILSEESER